MLIELVRKEIIESKDDKPSRKVNLLRWAIKLLVIAAFIAIEVFVYISLDNQLIANASISSSFDFLITILFITLLISIIYTTLKARTVLFSKNDYSVITPLPVTSGEIVFSKVSYLYLKQTLINICISSPILITYFVLRGFMPPFYVFGLVYGALISFFGVGISLIFSIVVEFIYRLLKLSDIVQFVCASAIVILLCYAYQFVLNAYLSALSTNEGTGMISSSLIEMMRGLASYLYPIYPLIYPLCAAFNNFVPGILIFASLSFISVLVGCFVASISYKFIHLRSKEIQLKKKGNRHVKVLDPFKALLYKEFVLLFKDSSYTFSYTALLIMAPFLSFVVISSLNVIIYNNLKMFAVYFPELTNGINILLILLFVGVINSSASMSISREGRSVQIVKYLPLNPLKQVVAKIITPIVLSSLSLIISLSVLISTGNIDYKVFLVTLVIGVILIIATSYYGLYFDMHDKSPNTKKLGYLTNVISIGLPLFILIIHFVLALSIPNLAWLMYILEIIVSGCILIPIFIKPKDRWIKVFRRMEVNG